ncbi:hypothetical protein LINGRAHAP2_LOCUS6181 [Linum grandiflorum]
MTKAKDNHTPLKHLSRASDAANRLSKESHSQPKKHQKIAKRSLVGEFTTISEDASSEITEDLSCFSEILEADDNDELIKNSLVLSPALSSTSEVAPSSHVPLRIEVNSVTYDGTNGLVGPDIRLLEADHIVNLLRKVQSEAPESVNANNRYKKILEELVRVILDEYCALPEETDWLMKLLSWKRGVVFLCFLTWSFVVCMLMLVSFDPGCGGYDCRLPPT